VEVAQKATDEGMAAAARRPGPVPPVGPLTTVSAPDASTGEQLTWLDGAG
jgi:hypothetical protein